MDDIEFKSYIENKIKKEFSECKNENDKWDKVSKFIGNHSRLLALIVINLPPELHEKILTEFGFEDPILN